jgi:2-haloacid dehalogenase
MGIFRKKKQPHAAEPSIRALLFDIFGTTVDWHGGMIEHARKLGEARGVAADWRGLVEEWRAHYKPAIKPVREGKRPWLNFDQIHREEVDKIVRRYGAERLSTEDRDALTRCWHLLKAWPDVVPGLYRLKKQFILGPLSNGTTRQLIETARWAGLPWDAVFGADIFRTYKPAPEVYKGAIALLGLKPEEVLMVAAHNEDLQAAQRQGLRTCFVGRPTEDAKVEGRFDFVVDDFEHLARVLGAV